MGATGFRGLIAFAVILVQPQLEAGELLAPGARLRLTAPSVSGRDDPPGTQLVGTLLALDAESLTLETKAQQQPLVIRLKDVTKLEVGHRGSRGKNALIGAAAGGLVLGLISAAAVSNNEGDIFTEQGGGFAMGALVGGSVGALLGAALPVEKWKAVPTPAPARVSIGPVRGGIRAAVTLVF